MYQRLERPNIEAPVLLVGFDGWIDAGAAGTGALSWIAGDRSPFIRFDSDELFDYRDQRPMHELREGVIESFEWPEVTMTAVSGGARDLVVLTGTEPALRWRGFVQSVATLAGELGVTEVIGIGGIPWAVPHTRPVPVLTTASDLSRIPDSDERPEGLIRVPAAISRAIEVALTATGIPAMGFWARVPHYVGVDFHGAALALVERISRHLGMAIDAVGLAAEADAQRIHLDAITEARPDIATMVERLEAVVDQELPASGEDLASEIERFLRNRPSDGGLGD
jgi:acetolactate synthase regulatory subunit